MSVLSAELGGRDYSKLEQSDADIALDLRILLLHTPEEIKLARQAVMREEKLSEQEVTTALLVSQILYMFPNQAL